MDSIHLPDGRVTQPEPLVGEDGAALARCPHCGRCVEASPGHYWTETWIDGQPIEHCHCGGALSGHADFCGPSTWWPQTLILDEEQMPGRVAELGERGWEIKPVGALFLCHEPRPVGVNVTGGLL